MATTTKLTSTAVRDLSPGLYWDTEVKGFGLRVSKDGQVRSFFCKYRLPNGRVRKPGLGRTDKITLGKAREMARQYAASARLGQDPQATADASKEQTTIADLCETYMERHSIPKKKPKSSKGDRGMIDKVIKPTFGRMGVRELTTEDIARKHHSMGNKPFSANRMVALLRHMLNMAERWGYIDRGTNPARFVEFYKETSRDRCLSVEEIQRLEAVLTRYETNDPHIVAFIRLLLLTGARRSEILTLRWDWVLLESGRIRLPDSKTGAKTIHLGEEAIGLLRDLPRRKKNPFVICGREKGTHLQEPYKFWKRIRKEAGLADVRLHDLRHTFASHAVSSGASLPTIASVLGHKSTHTTQRYAHLADRVAAEEAARMDRLIGGMIGRAA